jgi:hypothetical protein
MSTGNGRVRLNFLKQVKKNWLTQTAACNLATMAGGDNGGPTFGGESKKLGFQEC